MENDFLNTQINFKDDDNELYIGEVREGRIILSPLKDINVQTLGYQVLMEGRGRTSVIKKTQTKKILVEDQTLYAGETYEFDIEVAGVLPGSYKGKSIQFTWRVATYVELGESSYGEIRNALIKNFKLFKAFNPNQVLAEEREVFLYQEPQPYYIVPTKDNLKISGCIEWVVLIIGTILGIILMENYPSKNLNFVVSIIIGLLFMITVGTWLYKRKIIGNIISEVGNLEEDQFMVLVNLSKNWKNIKELQCHFQITEKVVDRRGTSNYTYSANIYSSTLKKKLRPNRNPKFVFDFPDKNLPASFQEGDVSFIWEIKINAILNFGFNHVFTQQVTVKKES